MKNAKTLSMILCVATGQVLAGTSLLNNNAVLSQATRAGVSANGDSHAIATADPNAASAVLDWTKFNVGSGQQMTFNGGGTTFFNLVDGAAGKSQIDGIINGTAGNVWVINPAGVAFSSTAQVDIGGLFAAAAGNISNADALRAGSAMLPEFSLLDGTVEADGAQFTADQVVLMGKSAEVSGVFYGDVKVAAGDRMVVDEIAGGKVDVSVIDFAVDTSVNTLELGDLIAVGDVKGESGGDTTLGDVASYYGNVDVYTMNGDITVTSGSEVASMAEGGEVNLVTAMAEGASGSIDVYGDVYADHLQLYAGYGAYAMGDVTVGGGLYAGDLGVDVYSGFGYGSPGGDVDVLSGGAIVSSGPVDVRAGVGYGYGAMGDMTIDGTVLGTGITLVTYDGADGISGNGNVYAGNSTLNMYAQNGSVSISGKVTAGDTDIGAEKNVILANDKNDFSGIVNAEARSVVIKDANAIALGQMAATDNISVSAGGDIDAVGSLDVTGGALSLESKKGGIVVQGAVSAEDADFSARDRIVVGNGANDFTGVVSAKGAAISLADDNDLYLGDISANSAFVISEDEKISMDLYSDNGDIVVLSDAAISSSFGEGTVIVHCPRGNVSVDGSMNVAGDTLVATTKGDVAVNGRIESGNISDITSFDGNTTIGGAVSGKQVFVTAKKGDLVVSGTVSGRVSAMASTTDGDIVIDGKVIADGSDGTAIAYAESSGDIRFGSDGQLVGTSFSIIKADKGDVTHIGGGGVSSGNGYAGKAWLSPVASADEVVFDVNGSIGGGQGDYFAVDGKMFAFASGNVSIAAAKGLSLAGGREVFDEAAIAAASIGVGLSLSDAAKNSAWDNNTVKAGGDLSVYTVKELMSNGLLVSGNDMVVSAGSFGDLNYLRAGGTLTINNVGHPKHPRIAYFESVNGHEPRIDNLPNDMVIFVDGRLAGGNINIMNMFGANEAFLVSTPELKSTQGIFGNPPFLHSDLDVANPMEVCAIDYLIQEVPRLTLSSEFPADVDQKVEANGLSLKDSYWFGQGRVANRPESQVDGKVAAEE